MAADPQPGPLYIKGATGAPPTPGQTDRIYLRTDLPGIYRYSDPNTPQLIASIDLGSFTGTLPVGHGGTGTAVVFTQGSVVFAGASGIYSQDNANFFWDATNHRLGLGTIAPLSFLHIDSPSVAIARIYLSSSGPAFSLIDNAVLASAVHGADLGFATAANFYVSGAVSGDLVIRTAHVGAAGWVAGEGNIIFAIPTGNNSTVAEAARITGAKNFVGAGNIQCPDDLSTGSFLVGSLGSYLTRQSSDGSTILNTAQGYVAIKIATTERARFTPNGGFNLGGTSDPGAGVIAYNLTAVMSWTAKNGDTTYQAASDGFILGSALTSAAGVAQGVEVRSDSSNPPTTVRQRSQAFASYTLAFCIPVRKGDFYTVSRINGTETVTAFWVPLGTAG